MTLVSGRGPYKFERLSQVLAANDVVNKASTGIRRGLYSLVEWADAE